MIAYYGFALVVGLLSQFGQRLRDSRVVAVMNSAMTARRSGLVWNWVLIALAAVLVAFAGLRRGVGTDYDAYKLLYRAIDSDSLGSSLRNSPTEAGFTVLEFLGRTVGASYSLWILVLAALSVVPVLSTFLTMVPEDFSTGILLYVGLGMYLFPMNAIRQGIAVAVMFYSYRWLAARSWRKYVLGCIAAFAFHASAIIAIAGQIVFRKAKIRPSALLPAAVAVGAFAAWTVKTGFMQRALRSAGIASRYDTYLNAVSRSGGVGSYLELGSYLCLIGLALTLGKGRTVEQEERSTDEWMRLALLAVPFFIIQLRSVVVGRLAAYFELYLVLYLCAYLPRRRGDFGYRLVLFTAAGAYYGAYLAHYGGLLPYRFSFGALTNS